VVKGFTAISRNWQIGDTIELNFPMPVRRVSAHEKVVADRGRVAFERGPIVYCAEGIDRTKKTPAGFDPLLCLGSSRQKQNGGLVAQWEMIKTALNIFIYDLV
jgi:DUF1680 family protein